MKRILILTEGQTEETFVRDILMPHLEPFGICAIPILAKTKRTKEGMTFKGGITNYFKVKNDINSLLQDTNSVCVTTMLDFYGIPKNFPGMATIPKSDCLSKVAHLEAAFAEDIKNPKFIPYLQLHEFEGLLFSSTKSIQSAFPTASKIKDLDAIKAQFQTPEHINDSLETAPHKRLSGIFPGYDKVFHGAIIAKHAGLASFRSECSRFDHWVTVLENLAK